MCVGLCLDGSVLDDPALFEMLNVREMSGAVAARLKYLTRRGKWGCFMFLSKDD